MSALPWICAEGTVPVSNIQQVGDLAITFSYCGEGDYEIKMTAVAPYCLAADCDYGNQEHYELNRDSIDGNGDDYVWTFSY